MKHFIISLFLLSSSLLYAKINTAVSILPEKTFVKAIGGDKVDVLLMVKPGSAPINYEPRASQMRDIMKSKIYFSIGVRFEKVWLAKLSNQNKNMKIVNITNGITKSSMPTFKHTNQKSKKEGKDPHVWTSPKNVKIMALNIYNALVKADSENQEYYFANYQAFLKKIDSVDKKIKEILKNTPKNTKFMVFHPVWGYFAKDYHLVQFPVQVEGKSPKMKDLVQIIDKAKNEDIKVIFTQPELSDKASGIIAKELNIKVVVASPLVADWSSSLIGFATAVAENR